MKKLTAHIKAEWVKELERYDIATPQTPYNSTIKQNYNRGIITFLSAQFKLYSVCNNHEVMYLTPSQFEVIVKEYLNS